jgi:hypothetical protein
MVGQLENDDLARMWEETVVAYFQIPSRHLPVGAQGDHGKRQSL